VGFRQEGVMTRTQRIRQRAPQDHDLWQVLFYRHQQQSRRRRLLALKALWDGQSQAEVCRTQHVQRKTLEVWMDAYLHGGFDALLAPQRRPRAQTLSPQRRKILRYILLHKAPADYGLDGYQWTARLAQALLQQKWQLTLSLTRLYEVFDELHLSHQRAHRDYGPARPGERARFAAALKKTPRHRPTPPSSRWTSSP
jgi:transposase